MHLSALPLTKRLVIQAKESWVTLDVVKRVLISALVGIGITLEFEQVSQEGIVRQGDILKCINLDVVQEAIGKATVVDNMLTIAQEVIGVQNRASWKDLETELRASIRVCVNLNLTIKDDHHLIRDHGLLIFIRSVKMAIFFDLLGQHVVGNVNQDPWCQILHVRNSSQ